MSNDPEHFTRMVHAVARTGHSFEMIYAHDPLPQSSRLTRTQHEVVTESHSRWRVAMQTGCFDILGWDHLVALMIYAFARQCDIRKSRPKMPPIRSGQEQEHWSIIWFILFQDQMQMQAREALYMTDARLNDVNMHDSIPLTQMDPFPDLPPIRSRPQKFSVYAKLVRDLASSELSTEVIKTVDARILKDADFDSRYAKLRARRSAHALQYHLESLSLAEDRSQKHHRAPGKVAKPNFANTNSRRKERIAVADTRSN